MNLQDGDYIKKLADRIPDVGKKMEYLLNTGNLISRSGLDLSQATGYTVVAEKLNFFRCSYLILKSDKVFDDATFSDIFTTSLILIKFCIENVDTWDDQEMLEFMLGTMKISLYHIKVYRLL